MFSGLGCLRRFLVNPAVGYVSCAWVRKAFGGVPELDRLRPEGASAKQGAEGEPRKARARMSFQREFELYGEVGLTAARAVSSIRPRTVVAWKGIDRLRPGKQGATNEISLAQFGKYLHALYLLHGHSLIAGPHSLID